MKVRIKPGVRILRAVLLLAAIACLGVYSASLVYQALYQADENTRFESELRAPETTSTTDVRPSRMPRAHKPTAKPSGSIGRINIQRLHLSAMVEEGISEGTLFRAVGHVPGTSLPGEPGNAAIAGHRDSFFRGLKDIEPGDRIDFETRDRVITYVVKELSIVDPKNTSVLIPTPEQTLTLVTCYPFHYIGSAPRRFIVRAGLLSNVSMPHPVNASWPR